MSAVSLPAKNAASSSSAPKPANRTPSDGCGIYAKASAPVPAEYGFKDELRTEIRQRQYAETAQGPAHRTPAAPSVAGAADQQDPEKHPRDQGQYRFVNEMLLE